MGTTYNHQYSDFTGGITTLPLNKRLPNQTDDILNCTVTEQGIRRRNYFHNFNADTRNVDCLAFTLNDGFLVVLEPKSVSTTLNGVTLKVYNQGGTEVTIAWCGYNGGTSVLDAYMYYPKSVNIRDAFSLVTVKDETFIVNRHKKPRMKTVRFDSNSMEDYYGMYFREATTVDGGYHYYITVEEDGVNNTDYHYKDTRTLCNFMGQIAKMEDYGNVVIGHWQQHKKVALSDSVGGRATMLLHEKVMRYEDLPPKIGKIKRDWYYHELNDGLQWFIIYEFNTYKSEWQITEVTRQEPKLDSHGRKLPTTTHLSITPPTGYVPPWLILEVTEGNSDDIGGYCVCHNNGEWHECERWGDEVEINESTFPIKLSKDSNDNFYLMHTPLKQKRAVGNNPSFIGENLSTAFYYKGRLGITTPNSISLSGVVTDDQLNFFKTTARIDIVSDTLNYGISTSKNSTILKVIPSKFGLFIVASDGLYGNAFNNVVSQDTNTISRITEESIEHPIIMEDVLYYITGGSLKAVMQGQIHRVGEHFRGKLDNIIDVAVHQPSRQLFFLDGDKKTIWVVKVLTTPNGDYYSLGRWTRTFSIYAIEVAKDKLILIQGQGIYACNLKGEDTTFIDDGTGDYKSEIILPKNILRVGQGYNSLLYKYIYKRLQLFLGSGEMAIELIRDNTRTERIEEQEVNIMHGTNQDTTIKLTSIPNKGFNLHFAESTLYVEGGNYKNI